MENTEEIKNKAINAKNAEIVKKKTYTLAKDTKTKGRFGMKAGDKVALTDEMAEIYKSKGLIK